MVRQIYYRGSLRFCNYSCGYCPFSKEKKSQRQLEEDERALFRFVERIGQKKFAGAIQIVPYGEALIHQYYWRALAKLSRLPQIEAVGAQSNFSFSVEQMLGEFEKAGGEKEKLRLWGTFHPDMVSEQDFLGVCHELKEAGILFCAGAVGVPENVSLLLRIREKLDPTVYFWINKMEGLGRKYSREEIQAFSGLDPYFPLELRHYRADSTHCGSALFCDSKGDVYACNRCRHRSGNLYTEDPGEALSHISGDDRICDRRECDCYISYCNRDDLKEMAAFGPYPAFRIPDIAADQLFSTV